MGPWKLGLNEAAKTVRRIVEVFAKEDVNGFSGRSPAGNESCRDHGSNCRQRSRADRSAYHRGRSDLVGYAISLRAMNSTNVANGDGLGRITDDMERIGPSAVDSVDDRVGYIDEHDLKAALREQLRKESPADAPCAKQDSGSGQWPFPSKIGI